MSIRNLIPPEQWEILKKPVEELKLLHYLVVCDTCQKVFLDKTLDIIKQEIIEEVWEHPQRWYVEAGRHWVKSHPSCLHEINAYLTYPSGVKNKFFGLSQDWQRQLREVRGATVAAMLNELNYLEQQIEKRTDDLA